MSAPRDPDEQRDAAVCDGIGATGAERWPEDDEPDPWDDLPPARREVDIDDYEAGLVDRTGRPTRYRRF